MNLSSVLDVVGFTGLETILKRLKKGFGSFLRMMYN